MKKNKLGCHEHLRSFPVSFLVTKKNLILPERNFRLTTVKMIIMLCWTILEELHKTVIWTTCLSILIFFIYWRGVASFSILKPLPIPGPHQWAYVGSLPDVIKYGGMHNMLWEYFQKYGRVYKMGFGKRPTIVVTDPEMIKQITIKEFPKFCNRLFRR